MTAGQLLRDARLRHGLTQKQLAMRAGTTQSAISRIERDSVSPTVETLRALLHLLGERLVLSAEEDDWGHDRTLLRSNLEASPEGRMARMVGPANFVLKYRGVLRPRL